MQDHVGDEFVGVIAAVTSFGLFVELEDIYIEGLVHITELSNDYYHFHPVRHCLEGERRHKVYSLGDTVKIEVIRVDLDEKKIDLRIVGSKTKAKRAKNKNSKTNTRTEKSKTAVKKQKSKSSRIHKAKMSTPKKTSKKKISKGVHNKAERKARTLRRPSS
jgi:ribonuclease R